MSLLRHVTATSLLVAAALAAGCASAAHPEHTMTATTEVRSLFESGIVAFNRHELDVFTRQFATDIAMYTPTGWLRGSDAVRARFDSTFRQFSRVKMEVDSLEVLAVAPASVTVAFRWRVYPMGGGPAFHGVGSGLYVRRENRWQEVLEHETVTRVDPALQSR